MLFGFKYGPRILRHPDDPGGGGGPDPKPDPKGGDPKPDPRDDIIKKLEERLAKLEKGDPKPDPKPDPKDDSLADRARKDREAKDKAAADTKTLEKAIVFTKDAPAWAKENEAILPKNIADIFAQAEKKNYGTSVEKAAEMKLALVSEFFAIKENLDLLTEGQKSALADFNALTETVKRERVQGIFETVFEPTFENIKRVRKAAQLNKGGANPTSSESAFEKKMQGYSKKLYLKEKGN